MIFDPLYFLYVGPALLLAAWAQFKVQSAFAAAGKLRPANRLTGAEIAHEILRANNLDREVQIEMTRTHLGDHYDPAQRVLRLSPDVYNGRSLAAFGVAAHEVGHALQHAQRYPLLGIRNAIVPMASFGSNAAIGLFMLGMLLGSSGLFAAGIVLFSFVVIFQLVNLPVEFDASARAKQILQSQGFISAAESPVVARVLSAAALTYVAATLTSVMTLIYYLTHLQQRD